jgi:thymidylate kinase
MPSKDRAMVAGRLICFEGIDGAGKTTVSNALAQRLRMEGTAAQFVSRTTVAQDSLAAERLSVLGKFLWDYPVGTDVRSLGDSHLILLMASWFHLFDRFVVRPALSESVVVTDFWFHKYLARFRAKQADPVDHLFHGLSKPDCVVFLAVTPDIAAKRKLSYSATEADIAAGGSKAAFIAFQTSVLEQLFALADASWRTVRSEGDFNEVLEASLAAVRNVIGSRPLEQMVSRTSSLSRG